jgi:BirA family biotin operon repressor/biotin-[acetyl-CoA-carboxylase] ligase
MVYDEISSTLDVAHALAAEGTPAGTIVLAETQTAGRGRNGRAWSSYPGRGIWLTVIEYPSDRAALDVLSLRIGLHAARALDPFAEEPIQLKWPNDLYVGDRKLAGILVEARWRDASPEWVAIGVGVNVIAPPDQPQAIGLDAGVRRVDVLDALVHAIREAMQRRGVLTDDEIDEYTTRDLARGRACVEPARGMVRGVSSTGELIVELADATVTVRSGSLVLA